MSQDKSRPQPITRRQFVQRSASATAAIFLTACVGEVAQPDAAPTGVAQLPATSTAVPATATTAPSATALPSTATATASTAATATTEPTATATTEPTVAPTETPAPPPTATEVVVLEPTPACDDGDDDDITIAQTEGPYFTPNSPERTSLLEAGVTGTPLIITGYVLSTNCQPIAGALVDFWHADASGAYDNAGYRLRGHQFTDAQGRYYLETIVPGLYTGRTRHLHVKVQAPNGPVLTTQQYFPDEPENARDGIFHPSLVMATQATNNGVAATFNYVLTT